MKRLLLTLCIFASTVSEAQSTQQSKKPLFANCWQQGVSKKQKSCVAHVYLNYVASILEVLRAPDAKPNGTAEAKLQAMLSDLIYRQQQKARLYRELCRELKKITFRGDSINQESTDIICRALDYNGIADSIGVSNILENIEPKPSTIVERAKADADAQSALKSATRMMFLSAASMTYMLLEPMNTKQNRLAMTRAEREALIAQSILIYRGGKLQPARFVLEQSVESVRKFLQGDWTVRQ
jgi:hypothetical protein